MIRPVDPSSRLSILRYMSIAPIGLIDPCVGLYHEGPIPPWVHIAVGSYRREPIPPWVHTTNGSIPPWVHTVVGPYRRGPIPPWVHTTVGSYHQWEHTAVGSPGAGLCFGGRQGGRFVYVPSPGWCRWCRWCTCIHGSPGGGTHPDGHSMRRRTEGRWVPLQLRRLQTVVQTGKWAGTQRG